MAKKLAEILQNNAQAVIIAIGLMVAAILWGGVYTTRSGPRGLVCCPLKTPGPPSVLDMLPVVNEN